MAANNQVTSVKHLLSTYSKHP